MIILLAPVSHYITLISILFVLEMYGRAFSFSILQGAYGIKKMKEVGKMNGRTRSSYLLPSHNYILCQSMGRGDIIEKGQ